MDDTYTVDLNTIAINVTQQTPVTAKSRYFRNKLLLNTKIGGTDNTIVVYTNEGTVEFYIHFSSTDHPLTRLLMVKSKTGIIGLTRKGLRLIYVLAIENKYDLPLKATYLTIADGIKIKKQFAVYKRLPRISKIVRNIYSDFIPMPRLLEGEQPINAQIYVSIDLGGELLANHSLTRGRRSYADKPKWYYAPITQTRSGDFSISIRRNKFGGLSLVRRKLEAIEYTHFFHFMESKVVSASMYYIAHLIRKLSRTTVNIYFEKNANQAEESVIDLCRLANEKSSTKNFFIINSWSRSYNEVKDLSFVVRNFTFKSYWLIYRANNVIASEVPQHVNILRSGNKYIRRAPYTQTHVFLQHGIIYLKSLTKRSSFNKGKEGEPDLMVVSSKKERDVVVDMFNIEEERLINSGLLMMDALEHNHISAKSPDFVTVMLTWRAHEEHLHDFSTSTYYRETLRLYELLSKYVERDRIRIVPHPKAQAALASTDMENSMWQGTISEALKDTKLLITDYSSVCYNVFYQGGAVVFYQPDLEAYELDNGPLIPSDNEYIGYRAHTIADMKSILDKGIKGGAIDIKNLRTNKFVKNYALINEHTDGKNVEAVYGALVQHGIL